MKIQPYYINDTDCNDNLARLLWNLSVQCLNDRAL